MKQTSSASSLSHILFKIIPLTLLLLTVLSSCFHLSTVSSADTDINQICPKTRNPKLCTAILEPGKGETVRGLGLLAINTAQESLGFVLDELNVLIKESKAVGDPRQQRYKQCVGDYDVGSSSLAAWEKLLDIGSYRGLPEIANLALTASTTCDVNFASPPGEPAQLEKVVKNFQDVCSVVSVISNLLASNKM